MGAHKNDKPTTKCDCTHMRKSHFQSEGCCRYCGCTWYHPNIALCLKRQKREKERSA